MSSPPPRSRSFKTIVLTLQSGFTSLTAMFVAAFLSRVLTKTELGTYRQILLPNTIFQPILVLGIPLTTLYFIAKKPGNARAVVITSLTLLASIAVLWGMILLGGGFEFYAEKLNNPALKPYVWFAAYMGVVSIFTAAFTQTLFGLDRYITSSLVGVTFALATVVATAVGWLAYHSLWAILVGQAIVVGLFAPIKIGLMIYHAPGKTVRPTFKDCRAHLAHAFDLGLATVFSLLHKQMDKFLVALFTTPEAFAVFTNGAREVPFVGIIQGSVTSVILPEMTTQFANNNKEKAHQLWIKATKKVVKIMFPLTAILIFFAPEIITLLFSRSYLESTPVFAVYLLLLPLRSISYGSVCIAAGHNNIVRQGAILGFVSNVGLTLALLPWLGFLGAAIATVISTGLIVVPYFLLKISHIFEKPLSALLPWRFLFWQLLLGVAILLGLLTVKTIIADHLDFAWSF